jgi:hypothetical protein
MRTTTFPRPVSAVLLMLAALAGCHSQPPAQSPAGAAGVPVSMFNGRDLTGWVQVLDSKWVVEDGALIARQDPKGRRQGESWLVSEKDYTDFALTLKFRVTPGGNSGVFLRDPISRADRLAAADGGPGPWEAGCEANINATDPEYPTGSIWSLGKAKPGLERPGEWNDMKMVVKGDHITTSVNDQPGADVVQTRSKRGAIGFQRHGTPQYRDKVVELKDIYIQEL